MRSEEICKIYVIHNTINKKLYIGQTWLPVKTRFQIHLRDKYGGCKKIFNAFNKYGRENFYVEEIASAKTQEDINYLEEYFIEYFDSRKNGYNITKGGSNLRGENNPFYGKKHTLDSKKKNSEAHKGKPSPRKGTHHTDESKQKISEGGLGNKNALGSIRTTENREKISKSRKGKMVGEDHPNAKITWEIANQIRELYNQEFTPQEIADQFSISGCTARRIIYNEAWIDSNYIPNIRTGDTERTKQKRIASLTGRKKSKETIQKISENRKGKTAGENHPGAKLTWEKVNVIRDMYAQKHSGNKLAIIFNVSKSTIKRILNNKLWIDPKYIPNVRKGKVTIKQIEIIKIDNRAAKEIAKDYNISVPLVYKLKQKLNKI